MVYSIGMSWIVAHAAYKNDIVEDKEANEFISATIWISVAYLIGFTIYNI